MKRSKELAIGMAGIMLMMCSCQNNPEALQTQETGSVSVNTGMGRYVESELAGPEEEVQWCSELEMRADGNLAFYDLSLLKTFVSGDYGATWTEEIPEFTIETDPDREYISQVELGVNGEYFVKSMDTEALENYDASTVIPTRYYYNDAQGNVKSCEFNEWENSCGKMQIAEDGTPYVANYDGEIYKIDVDNGNAEMILATKDYPNAFTICGNYLIVTDVANTYLMDLTTGQQIEDTQTLSDFMLGEGMASQDYSLLYECAHFAASSDGEAIYILVKSGIYRYVIGGSSIEQLVDGKLNSISEPTNDLMALEALPDGRFLVQSCSGKMYLYTFDEKMSSAPANELVIYTLYENSILSQAISDFQRSYPDTYVTCNVGIVEGSGITYDDALKNLNTEIMSGNAPDIYLLDYLPMNTYIEKEILAELSGLQEAWKPEENMYDNILMTFEDQNKLYAIPTRVSIPVLVCNEDSLSQINDLDSFVMEALHQHSINPDISIIQGCSEEIILRSLLQYAGTDFTEVSNLDQTVLTTLLTQAKTIYDMESETIPQEILDYYETPDIQDLYGPSDMALYVQNIGGKVSNLAVGQQMFALGSIGGVSYTYETITSANMQKNGDQGIDFTNGMGGEEQLYLPSVILGMSATTTNQELACEFIKSSLSSETQKVEFGEGLPVNRDAMLMIFDKEEEPGASIGGMMWDGVSGEVFSFDIYSPTEEELNELDAMLLGLDTPVIMDEVTRVTILELAPECMSGAKSVEETADEILEKIQLRLSE